MTRTPSILSVFPPTDHAGFPTHRNYLSTLFHAILDLFYGMILPAHFHGEPEEKERLNTVERPQGVQTC